jgi:hypothetical protein
MLDNAAPIAPESLKTPAQPMLTNWNFKDQAANSTVPQVNRQKSARNLEILAFDPSEPRAVFFDPKRNARNTATLSQCDCTDFRFIGKTPRHDYKPCMHIYRLAIELGLIEAKYLDHHARFASVTMLSHEETLRLQSLAADTTQWGGWRQETHLSGVQKNRQYRAYLIVNEEPPGIQKNERGWTIHGYTVSLDRCGCMDFSERKLPCKHIYAAAITAAIELPFSQRDYETARKNGQEIVFEFKPGT